MNFAYADPPYFGMGKRLYGNLHNEADIWDNKTSHIDLLARLMDEYPDGWALSCNPKDLAWLLPVVPAVRVCAWAKTFHQIRPLCTVQYAWEPVLLHGGRVVKHRKPMVRDWLACARSMKKGLVGTKPDAFNDWVLDLLSFDPKNDILHDLFPGSGGMSEAIKRRQLA